MTKRKKHLGFNGLEKKVEKEYRSEGYSKKTAKKWAQGTAANVYRNKKRKRTY